MGLKKYKIFFIIMVLKTFKPKLKPKPKSKSKPQPQPKLQPQPQQKIEEKLIKNNIKLIVNKLQFGKKIIINKVINYPFIFNEKDNTYLYYRCDYNKYNKPKPEHEITKRFIINNLFNIIDDVDFNLSLGIASHNFRLFNFNNIKYGIGGQSELSINYESYLNTTNISFKDFNDNIKFLENKYYGINNSYGNKFIDPAIYCPYYANGLYLFEFENENDNYKEVNNFPIISGIKKGRHDGHYGFCDDKNLKKSEDGLTVYDSTTSILYNENTETYFLYQRANIGKGIRYIQYCSSKDLINWGDFKLLDLKPEFNIFDFNIYYNNFFKLDEIDLFIGILPVNKKINSEYSGLNSIEDYELYYSEDCITWTFIGTIDTHEYYKNWIVLGKPIMKDNEYFFYTYNDDNKSINIFNIPKNRFSYFTNDDKNLKSNINLKLLPVKSNIIRINMTIFDGGYLKVQLKNKDNDIIEGYSFDDFLKIEGFIDAFDYILKWNNNLELIDKEVYIEIEGINFNLYSINNKLIYQDLLV